MPRLWRLLPIAGILALLLGFAYLYYSNPFGPTQEIPLDIPDEFFDVIPPPVVEPPPPVPPVVEPPPAVIDPAPPAIEPPPVIEPPPAIIDPPPVVEPPPPVPPVVEPPAPPVPPVVEPPPAVIDPAPAAVEPPAIEPPVLVPMAEISLAVFNFDGSRPLESGAAIRILTDGGEDYYLSCNNFCSIEFPPGTILTITGEWFGIPVLLNTGPNYLTTLEEDSSLDLNLAVYDDPDHRGRIAFENIRLDVSPFYVEGVYQLQVTANGMVPMRFQILDSSLEPRVIELNGIPYQATSTSVLTDWDFNIFTRVLSTNIEFQSTWIVGIGWQSGAPNIGGNNNIQNNNNPPNSPPNNDPPNSPPNNNPPNGGPNDDIHVGTEEGCISDCESGHGQDELIVDGTVPEFGGPIGLLTSAVFSLILILQFRRSKAFRAGLAKTTPK